MNVSPGGAARLAQRSGILASIGRGSKANCCTYVRCQQRTLQLRHSPSLLAADAVFNTDPSTDDRFFGCPTSLALISPKSVRI